MGNQAGFRFGQDGPSRITTVPSMYTEASEVMPYEPVYYPIVPFTPSIGNGGSGGAIGGSGSIQDQLAAAIAAGGDEWKAYPDNLDLFWWQGDDVQIRLLFPGEDDMSTWEWHADVRLLPSYHSWLYYEFKTTAAFFPEVLEDPALGITAVPAYTEVILFLSRQLNRFAGKGNWELHSISPYQGPTFDPDDIPPGVSDENWPPTTQLKTWLYGHVTIVPRTNDTDFLPTQPDNSPIVVVSHNWPNGMVP